MRDDQLEAVLAWMEVFLKSGGELLNQLKSQLEEEKQKFEDKTVHKDEAQILKVVIENKQIEGDTEMVLEDDMVELFGFEEVPQEEQINIHNSVINKNYQDDTNIVQDRLNNKIDCTICGLQFQDQTMLNSHFQMHHNTVTIQCNHCEFTATQPLNMNFHKLSEHKTSCNQCDYTALQIGDLNSHILRKHGKFKCEKCNYKSANMFLLRSHNRSMHDGIKVYCEQCNYKCATLSTLRIHKQSKHEEISHKCNLCEYKAARKDNLRTHVKAKHNK